MLFTIFTVLILLVLLDDALRVGRTQYVERELELRLFALRDRLRMSRAQGYIVDSNWARYLDTTISKTINASASVNIWFGTAYLICYRKAPFVTNLIQQREEFLSREENQALAEFFKEYRTIVRAGLRHRHKAMAATLSLLAKQWTRVKTFKHNLGGVVAVFANVPETSTLQQYGNGGPNHGPGNPSGDLSEHLTHA
jgi:hypothetical protein